MEDLDRRDPPLSVRPHLSSLRLTLLIVACAMAALVVRDLAGQSPAASLTVLSHEPRRTISITTISGQEFVALDDLATTFQTTLRDESGGITMSYKGRTIVMTADQTIASVAGRVISLPAPPTRLNGRWMVPVDFISRALAGIYDTRVELRRASHLVILGDLRVPRLTINQEPSTLGARVTIQTMPRAAATVTQDANQRLAIHFDADALDVAFPSGQLPGLVIGYRSLDGTAIAIDLGPRFASFRSTTQVSDAASTLVIDLLPSQGDVPPATPTVTRSEAVAPAPPAAPAELPSLVVARGIRTIVIDAGHGGSDTGARGAKGATEKEVTLAMARRVRAALESRLGVRVLMTREDDRLVAVSDRTALANNSKANLFVSLHVNGSLRATASGATIYVASFPEGSVDPQLPVPERLPTFGGGVRDIELVPWNLAQVRYRDASDALAGLLAQQFLDRVPLSPTPVDRAPLRLLESANMPAVLIETGFLTNANQEALLTSGEFHSALAQAIVDAIVQFQSRSDSGAGAVR